MADPKDLLLARIAVRRKLVTTEQVEDCFREQRRAKALSQPIRPLGALLITRKYLNDETLADLYQAQQEALRHLHAFAVERQTDLNFAKELVRRKLLSADQVNDCLREQSDWIEQGRKVRIAALIVGRGLLTQKDLDAVILASGGSAAFGGGAAAVAAAVAPPPPAAEGTIVATGESGRKVRTSSSPTLMRVPVVSARDPLDAPARGPVARTADEDEPTVLGRVVESPPPRTGSSPTLARATPFVTKPGPAPADAPTAIPKSPSARRPPSEEIVVVPMPDDTTELRSDVTAPKPPRPAPPAASRPRKDAERGKP